MTWNDRLAKQLPATARKVHAKKTVENHGWHLLWFFCVDFMFQKKNGRINLPKHHPKFTVLTVS